MESGPLRAHVCNAVDAGGFVTEFNDFFLFFA